MRVLVVDDQLLIRDGLVTICEVGYSTKDAGRDDMHRALQAAARGQALLDPAVHARPVEVVASHPVSPAESALPDGLTVREAEVLAFVARGHSNRQIATTLFLSEATVKTHINRTFAKTRSRDRAQAVAYAHRHQLA
jgi:DNA-binding NarL/FixJ family response regulator